jgi:hypothetical protein
MGLLDEIAVTLCSDEPAANEHASRKQKLD